MAKQPLFSSTRNFFLKLDVSRPAFKAQALYAADAVEADQSLPAEIRNRAVPLRTAALGFNEKLVESTQVRVEEVFGDVRVASDQFLRALLRRVIGVRYDPKSDAYRRFLPKKLREYDSADEQQYEVIFERLVKEMEAEKKPFQYPAEDEATTTPAADARAMLKRLQKATKTGAESDSTDERLRRAISADWRTVAIAEWRLWLALCDHFAEADDYRQRVYGYFDFSEVHVGTSKRKGDSQPNTDSAA